MQQEHSKKYIQIKSSDKEYNLTLHEYSRWLCLIEALDHITVKAKQLKQDMEKTSEWIKPLSFQKYIDERFDTMIEEISNLEKNTYTATFPTVEISNNICTTLSEPILQ
jgi:adenylate kinase family enzyme